MNFLERPVSFQCKGSQLIGILHSPEQPKHRGVLIIVGGPQTRVGSHRQFLLLARDLAAHNIPVLRFDYRGMGDSEGDVMNFEQIHDDIAAALDTFFREVIGLREVALWGLCDAASASMMYGYHDARVKGMALVNPWIRSDAGMAKTYLRHYYLSRLLDRDFWKKLISGKYDVRSSLKSLFALVSRALPKLRGSSAKHLDESTAATTIPFPERMYHGLEKFEGPVLLLLSGDDLTAMEFKDTVAASRSWRLLIGQPRITRYDLPEANHTFSSRVWRDQITLWTENWLKTW